MSKTFLIVLSILLAIVTSSSVLDASPLIGKNYKVPCDSATCVLPECHCMSTSPPMGLQPEEIPHLVLLTFDDALADWMMPMYDRILRNRVNPNGCPITMTFYVTHNGETNYQQVNTYYNQGHEIASHTVTHTDNSTYWVTGDTQQWMKEIDQQRDILHLYGNIPKEKIQGHRAPYLQTGGDSTYEALSQLGMTYDSSLPTVIYSDPPIWPFTLDYGVTHECRIPPCTTGEYKGLWDFPMTVFRSPTNNNSVCSMPDEGCYTPTTAQETYEYFLYNFQIYQASRTPFPIYQHVYWFNGGNYILDGFIMFLDYLATQDHIYLVTVSKALEWIKNPLTLEQLKTNDIFECNPPVSEPAPCPSPQTCNYVNWSVGHQMKSCTGCPPEYPWLDNPSGNRP